MRWIGQNIYDQISRFRSDVYLEGISTGTIASGGNLGLDSNNKIVKSADGGGDLTSIVAGTGLSGTSLTGPIPTLNVDASQTQITSVGTIGTGVWQGNAITTEYIGDEQITEGKLAETLLAEIDANTAKVTNSDQTKADINALDITEVGTISSGQWRGDAIASAYIAGDAINGDKIADDAVDSEHYTDGSIDTAHIADAQITVAKLHADAIQTSGESFADNDTSLMTSGAIDDRINTAHAAAQIGKNYRIVNCNFRADIGTTKYYLPLKSQDEQTALTREEDQEVAVCDGRLVSVTYRGEAFNTHSGDATVTFGVETNTVGSSYALGYSVIETEAVTINNADDQHLWHVVFDTAKHWDSTDMFAISIQSDTDITGSNERIFLTLVIEDDWSTYLAGATREIDTTP